MFVQKKKLVIVCQAHLSLAEVNICCIKNVKDVYNLKYYCPLDFFFWTSDSGTPGYEMRFSPLAFYYITASTA